jgi:hypothetical protein
MGEKQLVPSAWQLTSTSLDGGQKVPCQAQRDGFPASIIFPRLSAILLSLVSATKVFGKDNDSRSQRKSLQK